MNKSVRNTSGILVLLLAVGMILMLGGCAEQVVNPNHEAADKPLATQIPTRKPTAEPTFTPRPSPDMSGETFTMIVILSNEEPFTEVTRVIRDGLEDFVEYQNGHGGVNGAELEVHFTEVDGSSAAGSNAFEAISAGEDTLVVLIAAPVDEELYTLINQLQVPVINFGLGAESLAFAEEDDYLFWLVPQPEQQLTFWLDYALKNWTLLRPEGQFDVMRLSHIGWEQERGQEELRERSKTLRALIEQQNIVLATEGRVTPSSNGSASNPILEGVFNQSTMIYMDLFAYGPAVVLNDLAYLDLGGMFNLAGGSWALGISLQDYLLNTEDGAGSVHFPADCVVE